MNNATTSLRLESLQDQAFLARLYRSTRDDMLPIPEPMREKLLAMQFMAQQTSHRRQYPDAEFCIIEVDGKAAGCIAVHRGTESIRLINIALLPEWRNQGHGRNLIRALQEEAAAANKPLTLSVSTLNARAHRLYASLGFAMVNNNGAYLEMSWTAPRTF